MEEDIKNYLPTVMFRGTPCTFQKKNLIFIWRKQRFFLIGDGGEYYFSRKYHYVTIFHQTSKLIDW